MVSEFVDVWELLELPGFRVTELRFTSTKAPEFFVQVDGPDRRRYLAVARLGDWPDLSVVLHLVGERLSGAVDMVRVSPYDKQRGLRFWYAKGRARTVGEPYATGWFSTMVREPNPEGGRP